jgi:hypothetical protein
MGSDGLAGREGAKGTCRIAGSNSLLQQTGHATLARRNRPPRANPNPERAESDTPMEATSADVAEADWRKSSSCRVGRTDARNGHRLRTLVDGIDARRAEQTTLISQVVDLQGFRIRTRNALSRVSAVKSSHLRYPGRLAWHDRTPVRCGVQPKRLVKVREKGRLAKAAGLHDHGRSVRSPNCASRASSRLGVSVSTPSSRVNRR